MKGTRRAPPITIIIVIYTFFVEPSHQHPSTFNIHPETYTFCDLSSFYPTFSDRWNKFTFNMTMWIYADGVERCNNFFSSKRMDIMLPLHVYCVAGQHMIMSLGWVGSDHEYFSSKNYNLQEYCKYANFIFFMSMSKDTHNGELWKRTTLPYLLVCHKLLQNIITYTKCHSKTKLKWKICMWRMKLSLTNM